MSSNKRHVQDAMVEKMRAARKYKPGQFRPGESLKKERPDGQCEGPGCSNVVPGGLVARMQTHYFCSSACDSRYHTERDQTLNGPCGHCGEEVRGRRHKKSEDGQVFCNRDHMFSYKRERAFGVDNPLRQEVEEYISLNTYYNKSTLPSVKVSLSNFSSYIVEKEGLGKFQDVNARVVSRFIKHERARGLTNGNFIGHIKTFYDSNILEGGYDMANPVIPRFHSQRGAPTEARPYTDKDLAFIWNIVESNDDLALKLAFAIGKECGLRVGEVCNIRLKDVHQDKEEIFIDFPTKTMRTRTVPYHSDVAKYLKLWLAKRSPDCSTDHLLHSTALVRFTTGTMSSHFKKLLNHHPAPACDFKFHRCRHTWATRLMNNGMSLATLKVLGGWESWNSMQKYIKVLDGTVRRQYEDAYRKLQEQLESDDSETLSLLDFAALNSSQDATSVDTTA
jgi:integrase